MSQWVFKMSSSGATASMETSAPLANGIVNNAVKLQPIHQSDTASNRSHPALLQFKLAVLVFKALHGQAQQCLTDDCQLVAAAGRRQLRSPDAVTMSCLVPRTRMCLGDCAFGVAGPRLCNALPISLRQPHLSLGQFRRALKTHLFNCVCRA